MSLEEKIRVPAEAPASPGVSRRESTFKTSDVRTAESAVERAPNRENVTARTETTSFKTGKEYHRPVKGEIHPAAHREAGKPAAAIRLFIGYNQRRHPKTSTPEATTTPYREGRRSEAGHLKSAGVIMELPGSRGRAFKVAAILKGSTRPTFVDDIQLGGLSHGNQ